MLFLICPILVAYFCLAVKRIRDRDGSEMATSKMPGDDGRMNQGTRDAPKPTTLLDRPAALVQMAGFSPPLAGAYSSFCFAIFLFLVAGLRVA